MRRAIVLALALAGCVTPAAPSLAPRPASDLVTLLGGAPATGGCTGAERPIDRRALADGSTGPFAVPAGKVLVLTGVEWFSTQTGTGRSVLLSVLHRTPLGPRLSSPATRCPRLPARATREPSPPSRVSS